MILTTDPVDIGAREDARGHDSTAPSSSAPRPGPDLVGVGVEALSLRLTRTRVIALVAAVLLVAGGAAFVAVRSSGGDAAPARTGPLEIRYVAPSAAGSGDGSSWGDAAGLADVPALVEELTGGGEIWLRADTGPFDVADRLMLDAGGADGAPVVIRGVDEQGDPTPAVLHGTRTTPYAADGESGGDVFTLRGGADHLQFSDLAFEDVDNAFLAAGDVSDLVIADTSATNVRRFFENYKADAEPSADVSDLVIRHVSVTGFSKRVVHLRYGSHDVLLEDVTGDSQQQDGDDFAIGVHLEDEVHGVVLRRVSMSNVKDSLHSYWNGDGFATERGVSGITFEDTTSSGNTDAGYDLKSTSTTLVNAVAEGNKRNFRLWADDVVAKDCRGVDPVKRGGDASQAQVWLGKGAAARLENCTFTDDDPGTVVFDLEPGADLVMAGGEIKRAGELQKLQSGADVQLQDVQQ